MPRYLVAIASCLAVAALLWAGAAAAKEAIDEPVILVATPQQRDRLYGTSVLIVTPIGNRQHIGFIVNRPTPVKLSDMFPNHAPSKQVLQPIYLGGPENRNVLFALVQRQGSHSAGGLRLASDLYLEIAREKVDGVIESERDQARFFVGVVVWQPGELEAEIESHYWYVQDADSALILRKSTNGLWEELVKRNERNKNAITADGKLFFMQPTTAPMQ